MSSLYFIILDQYIIPSSSSSLCCEYLKHFQISLLQEISIHIRCGGLQQGVYTLCLHIKYSHPLVIVGYWHTKDEKANYIIDGRL